MGFRAWGLEFRGLRFRAWGLEFRGLGFRAWGLEFRGFACRIYGGLRCWVCSFGVWGMGFGLRVEGLP